MGTELELWRDGPRLPIPDKPSDYTKALTWVGGILTGIGVAGSFIWWLCYYLPFRAMSCDDVYDEHNNVIRSCHRVINDAFGYVWDGVIGAILFTLLMALLTNGLKAVRR